MDRNFTIGTDSAAWSARVGTGMSATVSVLSLLKQGDHIICIDDVYGGT